MAQGNLGRGWKFPVRVDQKSGRILMSENEDDIKESIRIILGTQIGSRAMRPAFGSGLNRFAFEIADISTLTMIKEDVRGAIIKYEHRIDNVVVNAFLDTQEYNKIIIDISYTVSSTNNTYNLVYPFYLGQEE